MATVVGFISEKGGVGKTTACFHIAVALARYLDKKVLVIDADYQRGGITGRFFPKLIENFGNTTIPGISLFHKFQELYGAAAITTQVDVKTWRPGVDVLVADPRLSGVTVDKLPSTNNIKANNLSLLHHVKTIDRVLVPLKDEYDYILIDSHPEVSDVMRAIIYAADYCVSPVKLDRQSSIGVATVMGEIKGVNDDIAMIRAALDIEDDYTDTVFAGAIGMMAREYGGTLKQTEQSEYNRLKKSGQMFKSYVTEGDGLRQAAAGRVPVYEIAGSNANKQSQQFQDLTVEFSQECP